jgi:hypothetical protein
VYGADGRSIAGFHSLSEEQPQRLEFPSPFEDFEGAKHYKDWVFKAGLGD